MLWKNCWLPESSSANWHVTCWVRCKALVNDLRLQLFLIDHYTLLFTLISSSAGIVPTLVCSRSIFPPNLHKKTNGSKPNLAEREGTHKKIWAPIARVWCPRFLFVFRKKHPLMFSIITPAFLGRFLYFLYQSKEKWILYSFLT